MKSLVTLATSLALVTSTVAREHLPEVQSLPPELKQKTRFLNPEYLVFSPKPPPTTKTPLLIFLHGAGGAGNNILRIKGQPMGVCRGIAKFGKAPCIIVAPQCLRTSHEGKRGVWIPEDLNLLLQHLKASLPVDPKRVYLTGNSMGGYGTWVWGGHHPEHFAAIAPIVGGIGPNGPKDVTPDLEKWAANLAKIPVYAFAGAKDKVVPAERSQRMIAAIRKAGGKQAKLKIFPEEAHGVGRRVFSSAEFYDWMFSKKRD